MVEFPKFEIFEYIREYWSYFSIVFRYTWWVLILVCAAIIYYLWLINKRKQYSNGIKHIFLAVTVPEDNEKNPQYMEQVFAGLHAIKSGPTFVDKWFKGKTQDTFTFEIVSIGGSIRYLIRTPEYFRDFVEANIYSQYPEAEIMEVDDYAQFIPKEYPNDKYDVFGAELVLSKPDPYPIKTYKFFTDDIEKEFIDPLSNLLEVMSTMSVDEQMWLQMILEPVGDDWKKSGDKIVNKLIGKKEKSKTPMFIKGIHTVVGVIEPASATAEKSSKKDDLINEMQYLTPGQKEVVEAIESNISKIGYKVKLRVMYVAKKEVFSGKRGINPLFGAFKAYGSQNLNNLVPNKKYWTLRPYFAKQRTPKLQKNIVRRYKSRDAGGSKNFIFNVEELATIYHFPYISVKAPSLVRAEARRGMPPTDLPVK
jgi:hypothetical protein